MKIIRSNVGSPLADMSKIKDEWSSFIKKNNILDPDGYLNSVKITPQMLGNIQISLSNRCNLHCDFCFNHGGNTLNNLENRDIVAEQFYQFLAVNDPIQEIIFTNFGELFFNKEAIPIMRKAAQFVGGFSMNTNALALTERKIDALMDFPVNRISVSIEASDMETYARYRKGGDFNKAATKIQTLATKFGSKLSLTSLVTTNNKNSVLSMPAFFGKLGIRRIDVQNLYLHSSLNRQEMAPLVGNERDDFVVSFVLACIEQGMEFGIGMGMASRESGKRINDRLGFDAIPLDQFQRPCHDPMRSVIFDPEWNFGFCCAHQLYPAMGAAPNLNDIINIEPVLMNRAMLMAKAPPVGCAELCFEGGHPGPQEDWNGFSENVNKIKQYSLKQAELFLKSRRTSA